MLSTSPARFLKSWLLAASAIPLAAGGRRQDVAPGDKGEHTETLLITGRTLLGQPISYPDSGPARLTVDVITIDAGAHTGWHEHDVPLLAYMLEGELTVDYGSEGVHHYREGDVIVEAIGVAHNGHNTGTGPARMLAVFLGAQGTADTVATEAPK